MVLPIDQGNVHVCAGEGLGGFQAAEPATDDEHMGPPASAACCR
jgi:hypothetical protein